jgi:hypothetical protein
MTATADVRETSLTSLYEQGLGTRQIAGRLGVSKDWVRHLLKRYDIAVVPAGERRYLAAVTGREGEIVAAFLRLRSDAAVARQLDLKELHVRRLIDARVPEAGVLRRARRTSSPRYSDQEVVAALRAAARRLPSPMGQESYRHWALDQSRNGRSWPGSQVAILRFGGWRKALAQAGLPANSTRGPQATYTRDDVVHAVAAAWRELGGYPSVVRYDAWRGGRPGLPTSTTARRFADSWDDLLVAAYPLVYGVSVGEGSERLSA